MFIVLEHQELRTLIEDILRERDPDSLIDLRWDQVSKRLYEVLSAVLTTAIEETQLTPETLEPMSEVCDHPDLDAVLYSTINRLSDTFGFSNIRTICVLDGYGTIAVNLGEPHDSNYRNTR